MSPFNQAGVIGVTVLLFLFAFAVFTAALRKAASQNGAQVLAVFVGMILITSLLVWAAINGHSPYPALIH